MKLTSDVPCGYSPPPRLKAPHTITPRGYMAEEGRGGGSGEEAGRAARQGRARVWAGREASVQPARGADREPGGDETLGDARPRHRRAGRGGLGWGGAGAACQPADEIRAAPEASAPVGAGGGGRLAARPRGARGRRVWHEPRPARGGGARWRIAAAVRRAAVHTLERTTPGWAERAAARGLGGAGRPAEAAHEPPRAPRGLCAQGGAPFSASSGAWRWRRSLQVGPGRKT